jgi:hypothetical protein
MLLPLGATAIVAIVLLWELSLPRLREFSRSCVAALGSHRARRRAPQVSYDPGRELRAEQRARALLRSCVNDEEWAMYRDLGFLRVWGEQAVGEGMGEGMGESEGAGAGAPYAYLIYPHRPIVAYVPRTGVLLNEYCVAFPDHSRPYGSARLPDADDVLAKWMALAADERRLISDANMHLPGRQLDPEQVRRDLVRLDCWQRERAGRRPQVRAVRQERERVGHRERKRMGHAGRGAGSVPAQ